MDIICKNNLLQNPLLSTNITSDEQDISTHSFAK